MEGFHVGLPDCRTMPHPARFAGAHAADCVRARAGSFRCAIARPTAFAGRTHGCEGTAEGERGRQHLAAAGARRHRAREGGLPADQSDARQGLERDRRQAQRGLRAAQRRGAQRRGQALHHAFHRAGAQGRVGVLQVAARPQAAHRGAEGAGPDHERCAGLGR